MTPTTSSMLPLRCAILLAGPTASGKTAAALALAERFPIEIISVDSALVYRQMDIGTAKPTPAELAAVPHHLIDIRDPLEPYSAADFARDALRLMGEIVARQRYPLLVGGTMLYFKALLDGLDELPAADACTRATLEAQAQARGWPYMHAMLAEVDAATAARLAPNDAQRIQRALEVYHLTGRPLSSWHQRHKTERPAHGPLLALEPIERSWLHQRIALRFAQMLEQGLVDEVLRLRARGDLPADLPAMRCVGYRQVWEALEAHPQQAYTDWPAEDRMELCNRGIYATRQLAKRQLTWLRGMPERISVACDAPDALNQIMSQAAAHIASTPLPA